jgi:hypothetical protein
MRFPRVEMLLSAIDAAHPDNPTLPGAGSWPESSP